MDGAEERIGLAASKLFSKIFCWISGESKSHFVVVVKDAGLETGERWVLIIPKAASHCQPYEEGNDKPIPKWCQGLFPALH